MDHHYLDTEDLQFIELLCKKIKLIGDYCETKPGIVSAANSYFIINEETENKFHLHKYTLPILQRGLFVNDDIIYTKEAYAKLIKEGKPSKYYASQKIILKHQFSCTIIFKYWFANGLC